MSKKPSTKPADEPVLADEPLPAPSPDPAPVVVKAGTSFERPLEPGYALGMIDDPAPQNRYPNITAARHQAAIANARAGFRRSASAVERQYAALTGTSQPAP